MTLECNANANANANAGTRAGSRGRARPLTFCSRDGSGCAMFACLWNRRSASSTLRSLSSTNHSLCRSSKDFSRSSDAFHERPAAPHSDRERYKHTRMRPVAAAVACTCTRVRSIRGWRDGAARPGISRTKQGGSRCGDGCQRCTQTQAQLAPQSREQNTATTKLAKDGGNEHHDGWAVDAAVQGVTRRNQRQQRHSSATPAHTHRHAAPTPCWRMLTARMGRTPPCHGRHAAAVAHTPIAAAACRAWVISRAVESFAPRLNRCLQFRGTLR
jgi:hypothetical protein